MRSKLILPILCVSAAFGEALEPPASARTFTLAHVQTAERLNDIAFNIRTTAGPMEASADEALKSITVHGTADQLALAEWLVREMDGPMHAARPCSPVRDQVYRLPGNLGSVGVFCFDRDTPLRDFSALIEQIRGVTKLTYTYSFDPSRVLVLRGTASQVDEAKRMIEYFTR